MANHQTSIFQRVELDQVGPRVGIPDAKVGFPNAGCFSRGQRSQAGGALAIMAVMFVRKRVGSVVKNYNRAVAALGEGRSTVRLVGQLSLSIGPRLSSSCDALATHSGL